MHLWQVWEIQTKMNDLTLQEVRKPFFMLTRTQDGTNEYEYLYDKTAGGRKALIIEMFRGMLFVKSSGVRSTICESSWGI